MPEVSPYSQDRLFERVLIWRAHEAHPELSAAALAASMGKPVKRVRRAIRMLRVVPGDLLKAYGHTAVKHWIKAVPVAASKGDHKPARDLLLHTRLIDPIQSDRTTGIQIIFNQLSIPGLPSFQGKEILAQNPNVLTVSECGVTDTGENSTGGADTSPRGPVAAPAKEPENFSPNSNG